MTFTETLSPPAGGGNQGISGSEPVHFIRQGSHLMNVKIIRPHEPVKYSFEPRKIRIEFQDGSYLIGFVNIHARYKSTSINPDDDSDLQFHDQEFMNKYNRVSDYLKSCNSSEGVITVFNATYGGQVAKTCFVFLHSVKLIMEEDGDIPVQKSHDMEDIKKEEPVFSLREKLKGK
ncbi:MAG: hypothetical protein ACUVRZ_08480 [Desulfobacca sp.]|uniref:hypothetical protein n=1 Tax=Desulfobacca sp. TaxID=2067990 RepID=UPI004049C04B